MAKIDKNYDGSAILEGYVLVPFECTEAELQNVINPDCIKTIRVGGQSFRVIYKAVPEEWEKEAKSPFNLHQNELLGHYNRKGGQPTVSFECIHGYDPILVSPEEKVIAEQMLPVYVRLLQEKILDITRVNPKLSSAIVLHLLECPVDTASNIMCLSTRQVRRVYDQAEEILEVGLTNVDPEELRCNASRHDARYAELAYTFLVEYLEQFA